MKCKPWIRHFPAQKFQCLSSQCALHGLRALEIHAISFFRACISTFPKDPAVPKILRCSSLLGVVNLLSHSDLLSRRTACRHHFPGNCRHLSPQSGVHGVVNLGGVVKTLRRSNSLSRSVFSTAGSFRLWVFEVFQGIWHSNKENILVHAPDGNDCKLNCKNNHLCNWNEIFQEKSLPNNYSM